MSIISTLFAHELNGNQLDDRAKEKTDKNPADSKTTTDVFVEEKYQKVYDRQRDHF